MCPHVPYVFQKKIALFFQSTKLVKVPFILKIAHLFPRDLVMVEDQLQRHEGC
jgi:hypothetical protein